MPVDSPQPEPEPPSGDLLTPTFIADMKAAQPDEGSAQEERVKLQQMDQEIEAAGKELAPRKRE